MIKTDQLITYKYKDFFLSIKVTIAKKAIYMQLLGNLEVVQGKAADNGTSI